MNRTHHALLLCLLSAGCSGQDVLIRGAVFSGPTDKSRPLAGAEVTLYDGRLELQDEATTNDRGRFAGRVDRGDRIYVVVAAEGYTTTSFTGGSGLEPVLRVPDYTFFGVPESVADDYEAPYAGCPGVGEGGFIAGEVQVYNLTDPGTGEHPLVTTAEVYFDPYVGDTIDACYLDADGMAYDPAAEVTGLSGRYIIAGIPEGGGELYVSYTTATGEDPVVVAYDVFMPENGVVSRFPTWVEFETPL